VTRLCETSSCRREDEFPPSENDPPPAGGEVPPSGNDSPPAGDELPPSGIDSPPAADDFPPSENESPPSADDPPLAGDESPPPKTGPQASQFSILGSRRPVEFADFPNYRPLALTADGDFSSLLLRTKIAARLEPAPV